ncbi:MAG: hypothetical protein K2X41_09110 [Hyphomicrobium sp.]|nr:hypothetical protein [Hyphomicrobium sp.]
MQDPLKLRYSARRQNSLGRSPVPLHVQDHDEASDNRDASELRVTLKSRGSQETHEPADVIDAPPVALHASDDRQTGDSGNDWTPLGEQRTVETEDTLDLIEARAPTDAPTDTPETVVERSMLDARDTDIAPYSSYRSDTESVHHAAYAATAPHIPSVWESLKSPLLAITAAVAVAAAVWSYSGLEDARAQLASVTEAKASVERSLAEARGRLTAAEKAVADVKAALTSTPATSPAKTVAPAK